MSNNYQESVYTRSINELIRKIDNTSTKTVSLVKDAKDYFESSAARQQQLQQLERQRDELSILLDSTSGTNQGDVERDIKENADAIKVFKEKQQHQRLARLERALLVCESILELCEGKDEEETLAKSAKFLGTVLLLSPGSGKKLPELHQRLKPAYKAVLSLRLVDTLMQERKVQHSTWSLIMTMPHDTTPATRVTFGILCFFPLCLLLCSKISVCITQMLSSFCAAIPES